MTVILISDIVSMLNYSENKPKMKGVFTMSSNAPTVSEGTMVVPFNPHFLDQLWEDSMKIQSKCVDVVVHSMAQSLAFSIDRQSHRKHLIYVPDEAISYGSLLDEDFIGESQSAYLTQYSFSQLCNKIGVPVRYMHKCEEAGNYDLITNNIKTWLNAQTRKEAKIRIYENDIRGILGSRYSMLDAPDIIQVVAQSSFLQFADVKGYVLDPTHLHIRLVSQQPLKVQGEDLYPGVSITSSDVGRSALRVQFFIYKQVCTNGLMLPTAQSLIFAQKHIGITYDEFNKGLNTGMQLCAHYTHEVEEVISAHAKSSKHLHLKETEELLTHGVDRALFSKETVKEIFDITTEKYQNNVWGLINGITDYAQKFTLERRLLFEEAAGRLLYSKI